MTYFEYCIMYLCTCSLPIFRLLSSHFEVYRGAWHIGAWNHEMMTIPLIENYHRYFEFEFEFQLYYFCVIHCLLNEFHFTNIMFSRVFDSKYVGEGEAKKLMKLNKTHPRGKLIKSKMCKNSQEIVKTQRWFSPLLRSVYIECHAVLPRYGNCFYNRKT